jgi:hypothetical protein
MTTKYVLEDRGDADVRDVTACDVCNVRNVGILRDVISLMSLKIGLSDIGIRGFVHGSLLGCVC